MRAPVESQPKSCKYLADSENVRISSCTWCWRTCSDSREEIAKKDNQSLNK